MPNVHIDIDALRQALMDYFGTAMASGLWAAGANLTEVELASPEELIDIAQREHFDLGRFVIVE